MLYDVKDMTLAAKGRLRMEWAERSMPVLRMIKRDFAKPGEAVRIKGDGADAPATILGEAPLTTLPQPPHSP